MARKRLQLDGQKFGKLQVVSFAGSGSDKQTLWNCICDCGNEIVVTGANLNRNNTKSCGCGINENRRKRATEKMLGMRFGRLLVKEFAHKKSTGRLFWLCVCDCGKDHIVAGKELKNGNTRSCGCFQLEIRTKHGHAVNQEKTPEYNSWSMMKQRCLNPSATGYENYGGRTDPGPITICPQWIGSFPTFRKDMGPRPAGTTIHRVDNDRGYSPQNCIWATRSEQRQNQRDTRIRVA